MLKDSANTTGPNVRGAVLVRTHTLNLPNSITLSRIVSIPLVMWALATRHLDGRHGLQEMVACILFVIAAVTDTLDGRLARSRRQITTLGILLDPIADKLLICSVFISLVEFNPQVVRAWVVAVVVAREFLVSGLRAIAASEGYAMPASNLGKLKMVAQVVSATAAILAHGWRTLEVGYRSMHLALGIEVVARVSIWFMLAVSVISAADYFVAFWSAIDGSAAARRDCEVLSR